MGDRALVIFVAVNSGYKTIEVSPTAYLHNDGSDVPGLLESLKTLMVEGAGKGGWTRLNDDSYALARFIGIVHATMPDDNHSLGCFETPEWVEKAIKRLYTWNQRPIGVPVWDFDKKRNVKTPMIAVEALAKYSHGDAGVIVVDCRDFTWKAYGGYLSDSDVKNC